MPMQNEALLPLNIAFTVLCNLVLRLNSSGLMMFVCNVGFIALFFGIEQVLFIVTFCAIAYAITMAYNSYRSSSLWLPVLLIIIFYMIFKKYSFLPALALQQSLPELIGISYILFRSINVLIDCHESKDRLSLSLVVYSNYCLSFWCVMAGPIQRYRDYLVDLSRLSPGSMGEMEATLAFRRIANGVFKTFIVAALLFKLHAYFAGDNGKELLGMLLGGYKTSSVYLLAALSYLAFLYCNFSGYTDIAIGLGALLGFRLPENFDRPFDSTNFLDFWSRWHMSLSFWFRDYLFNPLLMAMLRRWPKASLVKYYAVFAYFLTFFLLGVWHGRTLAFVFCGCVLAAGASANKLFQIAAKQSLGTPRYQAFRASGAVGLLSIGATSVWIGIAITGLWLPWEEMVKLAGAIPARSAGVALVAVSVAAGGLIRALNALRDRAESLAARFWPLDNRTCAQVGVTLKFLAVMLFVLLEFRPAPPFVYQGF